LCGAYSQVGSARVSFEDREKGKTGRGARGWSPQSILKKQIEKL